MTVAIGINSPASPKPTPSAPLFQKNANKRWPPMANRNTLPYKLTLISKEKLAREATAPDPCLRRCVAHFRLHCGSILWTENDMKSRISSFDFEETDSEDEADPYEKNDDSKPAFVRVEITESASEPAAAAATVTPPPEVSPDNGMMDQGCIDVSPQNLCCVSVPPFAS